MTTWIHTTIAALSVAIATTALVWNIMRNYSKDIKDSIEKAELKINDNIEKIEKRIDDKIDEHRKDFREYMKRTDERMDRHFRDHGTKD